MDLKTAARTRFEAIRPAVIAFIIVSTPTRNWDLKKSRLRHGSPRCSRTLASRLTKVSATCQPRLSRGLAVVRCTWPFVRVRLSAGHWSCLWAQPDCRHGRGRRYCSGPGRRDLGVTIRIIGTPAEEMGGGGKILLLERGAFAGAHAAMMVHPYPVDSVAPLMLANAHFGVRYTGKEAHAAAYPELGINAADALTVAQVAIGLLRQHIHPTDRVHGIITKGGEAPSIIPAETTARYIVRAKTLDDLETIRAKVLRCFEAGALATGAQLEIFGSRPPYAQVCHDPTMAALYRRNAEALGRVFPDLGEAQQRSGGSTDMGNVSLALPSIHPAIGINSLPAVNHQPEFTAHCLRSR